MLKESEAIIFLLIGQQKLLFRQINLKVGVSK